MKIYKPETLEENYANIKYLKNIYWNQINALIWSFNDITDKYNNPYRFQQLMTIGAINPYLNGYEDEMRNLAYEIYGFTSNIFETLAYALDYWRVQTDRNQRNRAVTDKEYDQSLKLLAEKKKISGIKKEVLLKFRVERNFCTHYGRTQFCRYVFDNSCILFELVCVIEELLRNMNKDNYLVTQFSTNQEDFIGEMRSVLGDFRVANPMLA